MLRTIRNILIFSLVSLELLLAFSFSIDKPSIYAETTTGKKWRSFINITNNNNTPLKLKAYVMDWHYGSERQKIFTAPGSRKDSCAKWIALDEREFTLEPKEKKAFFFEIDTPKNAVGGSQAVIFFEADVANSAAEKKGLSLGARIGALIYQNTKGASDYRLGIEDQKVSVSGGKFFYKVTVKNNGNTWNSASGVFSLIKNEDVAAQNFSGVIGLLPGETYVFSGEFAADERSDLIYSIEDHRENILSERINASTVDRFENGRRQQNGDLLTVDLFSADYTAAGELQLFLKLTLNGNPQIVLPEVKIFDKKNNKRVKTVALGERLLQNQESAEFKTVWSAGEYLPAGSYSALVSVEYQGKLVSEKRDFEIKKR